MNPLVVLLALVLTGSQAPVPQATAMRHAYTTIGTYRIAGIIIDANSGAPIPGAQLSISDAGNGAETTADDGGNFSFDGLPPGKYNLSASAHGYVSASYDQHGQFNTAIVVGNALDAEHVVFRLAPQGVIYGTVTNTQGDVVRMAQVMLFEAQALSGSQHPVHRATVQTNDLGQYRFAHLHEGSYYVVVQAQPWYAEWGFTHPPEQHPSGDGPLQDDQKSDPLLDVVYPITFFPGVTDPAAANELHITPGDQEEADVQLVPVPSAHVLVTGLPDSPQGMPYPNIRADDRIFGTSTGMLAPIQRREVSPGTWEIDGLPPGQVALVMQDNTAQGWSERTIATNVSDNSTIDASGAPSGVISGRVILPAGASAGETRVMLVSAREGGVFEASVRKNGTFTFPPLQPGTYRIGTGTDVLNGRSGTRPYIESVSATGAQVTGRTITIFDSGNVDVTVKVGFGRAVVNGIAKLSGKPAPGVMVLLVPTSGQDIALDSRRDQTNSDGSFTLSDVIPGKYILMAISNAWKLDWTDPAALKPYRDKGQAIEITPAQTQSVTVDVQALLAK